MVPQQRRRRRRVVPRTSERRVVVLRGVGGFGFTIAGQRPCVVSAVAAGGPAERAGLRAGDALLAVDGASVARAPHAAVARLVAGAPSAISLSVAPREAPPTDTEDTEPDERARTRRRHPPPRRRPQPPTLIHHPACHAIPSASGVSELLQNISRVHLMPHHAARLECRAVVGYLGTIETPQAAAAAAPGNVRSAVRKLRQERRPATPVLLSVLPDALLLRRPTGQVLAHYARERILHAGCGSDADRRYFGLVTAAETPEAESSHSCHVFAVDPRMAEHEAHSNRAREFQIACTRDPVAERCLEFPPSAEYVVGVIRGMYSLPAEDCSSPNLLQISKLAVKGDSPGVGHFARCNNAVFRVPRDRRPCRHDDDFLANSPQPSNHSEITTTSSNSDSGIGFHNDCRNIADRILVVDFAGPQPAPNRFRQDLPRRPAGLVGCSGFEADGSFLSNTTPVVDGFAGQGRPLNLDDVIINSNELQPVRRVSPRAGDDKYNYNNIYGNVPSTSKQNGAVYDQVYTETEGNHYEPMPSQLDADLEIDSVTEAFNSVEIYEERSRGPADYHSNESIENVTVISGATSKASMDSVSMYSSRSHEDTRPARRKHLQSSLDDMLVFSTRDSSLPDKDEGKFLHPASIKFKVRKSKPLNLLSRTKHMLTGRDRSKDKERRRAMSASAGDVCAQRDEGGDRGAEGAAEGLPAAASEPDLRDTQSEQSSPFRRWTTGGGAGSSYRHHDPRTIYNKQMSEGGTTNLSAAGCGASGSSGGPPDDGLPKNFFHGGKSRCGGVSQWSLGLEYLLNDSCGVAAFSHFLANEFAHENIRFWWFARHFHLIRSPETRRILANDLWDRHIAEGCPEPVNLDAATRHQTAILYNQNPLPLNLFEAAHKQIYNVMRFDSYPRFLRSDIHAECARADLRGQPTPYRLEDSKIMAAPSPVLDAILSLYDDLPLLKKSLSNASERRRSGGSSLIPWRLRAASRERALAPPAVSTSASAGALGPSTSGAAALPPQPPTPTPSVDSNFSDVVKNQNEGQCSLCRVVLPDRATSVVTLDASVTVRQLIDRLLQRRKLACTTYDVVLKDRNQVEVMMIDPAQPSTVLAGHVVSVDRRCTLRIDVNDRLVSVRCRPNRQLQHIVKPVLKRYGTEALLRAKNRVVLRDGTLIDLSTNIQELDGARLQIVDLDSAEARASEPAAAGGDVPEPPAPAARIQEDLRDVRLDEPIQRPASSVSRYQSDIVTDSPMPGPSGLQRWHVTEASSSSASSDASGGTGGGASAAGSARVRAALRPGAPLHHHPPDFLENLRETQRQRLQSRGESEAGAAAHGPHGPHAPPPLPPKPRRTPTLV